MKLGQIYRKRNDHTEQCVVIGVFGSLTTLYDPGMVPRAVTIGDLEDDEYAIFHEKYELCPWNEAIDWAEDIVNRYAPKICEPLESMSRWEHVESGTTYVVIGNTNTTTEVSRRGEFPQEVVYEDEVSGESWSRPIYDFLSRVKPLNQ